MKSSITSALALVGFVCSLWNTVAGAQALTPPPPPAVIRAAKPPEPKARVVIAHQSNAVESFNVMPEAVRAIVSKGIRKLAGKDDESAAWRTIVSTNDTVGIKVYSAPGPSGGTRAAVVEAVVQGLLAAGLPPHKIIVWDRLASDLRLAGFYELASHYDIRVLGALESGYDEKVSYETALVGNLVWGDLEFGRKGEGVGRKSYVTQLLTHEVTKIISITPLLNHNNAAVTGHLYSLALGSVDNVLRFEMDPGRLTLAVPEIFALEPIADHFVLGITDALICQYQGEQRSLMHYATTLNELRFSKDPVALDVLSIEELERQRSLAKVAMHHPKIKLDLFQNATLVELGVSDSKLIKVDHVP